MEKYKILNLYACLGGNRYKWDEVSDNIEVTAVEQDPELAALYTKRFPPDKVLVGDAHQYLLDHYQEYDFIWTSPPCPTHSRPRYWSRGASGRDPVYPDMKLYQEIIFLKSHHKGKYCVENVIPYYEPLIPAEKRGRHLYWANFHLPDILGGRKPPSLCSNNEINKLSEFHDYNFYLYKGSQRRDKIARNLVDYEAGRTILETAMEIQRHNDDDQRDLFSSE